MLKSVTDKYRVKSILFVTHWENKKGCLTSETQSVRLSSFRFEKEQLHLNWMELHENATQSFSPFWKKILCLDAVELWLNM